MSGLHENSLRFTIEERDDGARVTFEGRLDENADLSGLRGRLAGRVEFHLAGISRINSTGVRIWVNLVHDLPSVTELAYSECSPAIVTQLNTIYNFRGPAKVWSLLAPYACEACAIEECKRIDVREHVPADPLEVPRFHCARCDGLMAFDDLPERYLSFLHEV
ncbi:MAG: hypothetical protein EXR72_23635 [Myxococcales bacterium]|nr:hypothetical protein [Myxococcales bacterium]